MIKNVLTRPDPVLEGMLGDAFADFCVR